MSGEVLSCRSALRRGLLSGEGRVIPPPVRSRWDITRGLPGRIPDARVTSSGGPFTSVRPRHERGCHAGRASHVRIGGVHGQRTVRLSSHARLLARASRRRERAGSKEEPVTAAPCTGLPELPLGNLPVPAVAGQGDGVRAEAAGRGRVVVVRSWPRLLLALAAAVATWSGWVGIGRMTGFGLVRPLPGIWDSLPVNTAVTLPVGVEAYAAFALRAWLSASPALSARTRRFARWSATGSLGLGMAGQVAYHLLAQAHTVRGPGQRKQMPRRTGWPPGGCGSRAATCARRESAPPTRALARSPSRLTTGNQQQAQAAWARRRDTRTSHDQLRPRNVTKI
jgi:hypothetical protein